LALTFFPPTDVAGGGATPEIPVERGREHQKTFIASIHLRVLWRIFFQPFLGRFADLRSGSGAINKK
jgi:hypothetical protein